MSQKMSKRITLLGLLMTASIVAYHCGGAAYDISFYPGRFNVFMSQCFESLAIFAMSYFFMTTGFLLFYKLNKDTYRRKIVKRVSTLLIPYICWQVLTIIYFSLHGAHWDINALISTIFLFDCWPPDGALWYIYAVFFLAIFLTPILLTIFKNKKMGYLFVISFSILLLTFDFIRPSFLSHGYIPNLYTYLPSYLFGSFFGFFCPEEERGRDHLPYFVWPAFLVIFLNNKWDYILLNYILRILPVFLLYYLPIPSVLLDKESTVTKIALHLSNVSFLVYALHQPLMGKFISFAVPIFDQIPIAIVGNLLIRISCVLYFVLLALLIHLIMKMFAPKLLQALTGGRS